MGGISKFEENKVEEKEKIGGSRKEKEVGV